MSSYAKVPVQNINISIEYVPGIGIGVGVMLARIEVGTSDDTCEVIEDRVGIRRELAVIGDTAGGASEGNSGTEGEVLSIDTGDTVGVGKCKSL